jgi:hypothetical protein
MIGLEPISAGISLITSIISRVWPDKTEQEKEQLAAAMQADANFTALLTGQLAVNAAEAANESVFIAGWRPAVGWVCASAFAWQFVALPILLFVGSALGHQIILPVFDFGTMSSVLMGMLGLGAMRSFDKLKK